MISPPRIVHNSRWVRAANKNQHSGRPQSQRAENTKKRQNCRANQISVRRTKYGTSTDSTHGSAAINSMQNRNTRKTDTQKNRAHERTAQNPPRLVEPPRHARAVGRDRMQPRDKDAQQLAQHQHDEHQAPIAAVIRPQK